MVRAVKRSPCLHSALPSFEGGVGGGLEGLAGYEQAAYYRIFPDRWSHVVVVLAGGFG